MISGSLLSERLVLGPLRQVGVEVGFHTRNVLDLLVLVVFVPLLNPQLSMRVTVHVAMITDGMRVDTILKTPLEAFVRVPEPVKC